MIIRVAITAKNEAANILQAVAAVRLACQFAEEELNVGCSLTVVLNDTTDNSADLLHDEDVMETCGGLVSAQRAFVERFSEADFHIFSDADILVSENSVFEIARALLQDRELRIAYAEKIPLKPFSNSILAKALYSYNLNNGYQSARSYFNGQLFGIRDWKIPTPNELRFDPSNDSNFLNLNEGIRCDDIYLSRIALEEGGPIAIKMVDASIWYRPPESLSGMYRKYQRMQLEIERLNVLFPKSTETHARWGKRRFLVRELLKHRADEIILYAVFIAALYFCKLRYVTEKVYYTHFSTSLCPTWRPVLETKRAIK